MKSITLHITGMSCDGCVRAVTNAIQDVDGVSKADVSLDKNTAVVSYDDPATPEAMIAEVTDYGYGASMPS